MSYDFKSYKADPITRASSKAWGNWMKFQKIGDMVQGIIRDVFYRKAADGYDHARGITLEQPDGSLINVSIKRYSWVLDGTNHLRLGDPLTVVFESEKPNKKNPGYSPSKNYGFYGKNVPETEGQKTVAELDAIDMANGGMSDPASADDELDEIVIK